LNGLLWGGGRQCGFSATPYGVKCSGTDSSPPFCWITAQEPMHRGTNCEAMGQRRRPGAPSAAGAPACPHSAAVESAEARLPTRELAGRAASSAAGGQAESRLGSEASAAAAPASTAATAPGRAASSAVGGPAESPPGREASAAAAPASTAAMAPGASLVVHAGREASWAAGAPALRPAWGAASSAAGAHDTISTWPQK